MRRARLGCSRSVVTALAIADGSPGGTTSPVSPSRTSAAMSPVAVETTGSPAAKASSTDTGWLSTIEELTKMSAASYRAGIAAGSTRPTKRIPSVPSATASRSSRARSLPSPVSVSVASG